MPFNWFDAQEAKEFGVVLARFHIENIPLDKTMPPTKQQELLNKLFQQMVKFKLDHKLNIYKRAQLGNVFKWELMEAGYDREYVDQITKQLMLIR
ncbi:MAG: hypothetical protein WAW35_00960 [Sideroxyarcus sp.]